MKITLLTLGTRGDVQPFVALGCGLKKAGHEVKICTSVSFKGFILEHGLDYGYMSDEVLRFIRADHVRDLIDRRQGLRGWMNAFWSLASEFKLMLRDMLDEQWAAAQGAEVVIYHPKAMGGYHLAEGLGVLGMMATPFPAYVPTRAFPLFIFPALKLGGWYNRLTYALAPLGNAYYARVINAWRKELLGLPKRSLFAHELTQTNGKPVPIMHCYSPHLIPTPEDWAATTITTGYWFLESRADWQPPEDLLDFLAAGAPPVYVGFGSMVGREPEKMTRLVLDALAQAGQRGVMVSGWGGLKASTVPKDIYLIDSIPHAWLFPHMAAVVHHGGAGTTAAGLRAGKPTVICPFFADQPFWGQRLFKIGAGPEPIPQKALTVSKLSKAIYQAATSEAIRQRAAELGAQIRAEDGVGRAMAFIDEQVAKVNGK